MKISRQHLPHGLLILTSFVLGCGDSVVVKDSKPEVSQLEAARLGKEHENPKEAIAEEPSVAATTDVQPPPDHYYFHKSEQPHAAEWSYDGAAGPDHWGELTADYSLAATGRRQSPIDIQAPKEESLPAIGFDYGPCRIDLVYNGHTVKELEDKNSSITVDGEQFVLQQFHFHSPSEHTINGRHSDMEMHLVHASAAGKVAVVGILIEEGADNAAFDQIWSYLPTLVNRVRKGGASIDASTLLPGKRDYYRYSGSFTTPPCTEDVLWMVLTNPVELSAKQVETFRKIIDANNRPVQPLNGRTILVSP